MQNTTEQTETMIVAKVYLDGSNPVVMPVNMLSDWLRNMAIDEPSELNRITVDFTQMSTSEYLELDEHSGW